MSNLKKRLAELKKKNAKTHKENLQKPSSRSKSKNRVKMLHSKQVENARLVKAKKEEISSEKLLSQIDHEVSKSIVNDMLEADFMILDLSEFVAEFNLLCEELALEATLTGADVVPTPEDIAIRKDVVKDFQDAFGFLFDFKKTPIIEAVEIANQRKEEAIKTVNECLKGLDEFDAYRNCEVSTTTEKDKQITTVDEADNSDLWFERRGNKGIALYSVKKNLVESEIYRNVKFASLVEKEKKKKAI